MALANVTDSTVSDHLKEGGIWRHMLEITGGLLWSLKPEFREGSDDDPDASPFD